jgi:hypothetical protein
VCGDQPVVLRSFAGYQEQGIYFQTDRAYQLDKEIKVAFGYVFQQRRTEDYYYNTLLYGFTPNRVMPTNEQAPNYSVSLVSASYIYSFK